MVEHGKRFPIGVDRLGERQALMEYSRAPAPLQWATTQNNLGNALSSLGERESSTETLNMAVDAYREALKVGSAMGVSREMRPFARVR